MKLDLKAYAEKHPALAAQVDLTQATKRSKYGNVKTKYDGKVFDSKLEAACAAQLDALMKQGFVRSWAGQVRYDLGAKIVYVADFVVDYAEGSRRVIDAKGLSLPIFRLKRRLFESLHGPLDVVKRWQDIPLEGR